VDRHGEERRTRAMEVDNLRLQAELQATAQARMTAERFAATATAISEQLTKERAQFPHYIDTGPPPQPPPPPPPPSVSNVTVHQGPSADHLVAALPSAVHSAVQSAMRAEQSDMRGMLETHGHSMRTMVNTALAQQAPAQPSIVADVVPSRSGVAALRKNYSKGTKKPMTFNIAGGSPTGPFSTKKRNLLNKRKGDGESERLTAKLVRHHGHGTPR
jgi:hypothetical protein